MELTNWVFDFNHVGNTMTMISILIWCDKNFGEQSSSTWKLEELRYIHFYKEKYYTMFLLYWGDRC